MNKYICTVCGYIFDENDGVMWNSLPDNWLCPLCKADKSAFELVKGTSEDKSETTVEVDDSYRALKESEFGTLCLNLAKGCEKQYLEEESNAFVELAQYFDSKEEIISGLGIEDILSDLSHEIDETFKHSNNVVDSVVDRGSKRALVWSEKVTRMNKSILNKYQQEGDSYIQDTNIYVCEICGFVYIGDEKPDVCPVCKVPNFKMREIRRD